MKLKVEKYKVKLGYSRVTISTRFNVAPQDDYKYITKISMEFLNFQDALYLRFH